MLILSSKTARLLMDIFKALTVSTFTWEALSKFSKPDKTEWLLGFVVPASYISTYTYWIPVTVLPVSDIPVYMF